MPRASAWAGLVLFALLAQGATSSAAGAAGWIASEVRGTVVKLVRGEWQECERGAKVAGEATLRTLRGSLVLEHDTGKISLGGGTAIQLDRRGDSTTVRQYSGTVIIEAAGERIAIETPVLAVVAGDAVATVVFDGDAARVRVDSGTVTLLDRVHGASAVLAAGQAAVGTAAGMGVRDGIGLPPVAARGRAGFPVADIPPRGPASARAADPGDGQNGEPSGNAGDRSTNAAEGRAEGKAID